MFVNCGWEMNEAMILTHSGQSQRSSRMCTWKMSGVFNGTRTHDLCDAGAELSPGQSIGHMCSCERNDEWKRCLQSVVERWIEPMILTSSGLCQGSSHIWALYRHRRGHGGEYSWRHLNFLRRTNETIAEIIKKVWGSLLQFMTTNNRQILGPDEGLTLETIGFLNLSRGKFNLYQLAW